MVSVQKCFRTVDIDEVGDESHCTFFFMLGNFSVGDYFKRESLAWSWEFLTEDPGYSRPIASIPTVHPTMTRRIAIWRDVIGMPEERIGRLDDNWWGPVGATGPNGPDSEIYFDRGAEHGCGMPECAPGCECERYPGGLEQRLHGVRPARGRLTHAAAAAERRYRHGAGAAGHGHAGRWSRSTTPTSIRRSSSTRPGWPGVTYGGRRRTSTGRYGSSPTMRGAATFLIADGVLPGNEGRSYVLRRILRRAIRPGRKLGLEEPFLAAMAGVVIDQFAHHYPKLSDRRVQIEKVLAHEEESFGRTLSAGMARFQALVEDLARDAAAQGETVAQILPGREVFRLYDTYGFPFDLTVELAREQGLDSRSDRIRRGDGRAT